MPVFQIPTQQDTNLPTPTDRFPVRVPEAPTNRRGHVRSPRYHCTKPSTSQLSPHSPIQLSLLRAPTTNITLELGAMITCEQSAVRKSFDCESGIGIYEPSLSDDKAHPDKIHGMGGTICRCLHRPYAPITEAYPPPTSHAKTPVLINQSLSLVLGRLLGTWRLCCGNGIETCAPTTCDPESRLLPRRNLP